MHGLNKALDRRGDRLNLFFRDDDAGWRQDRLDAMLSVFARLEVPIDLAAIPAAMTEQGAGQLNRWRERHPGIGVHQHGYCHHNHEPEGARKCEFGPTRPVARQCADIAMGRERMLALFGTVDPIFTPPWNRISAETVQALPGLGFALFSDDGKAARQDGGPRHLPVDCDWERERRTGNLTFALERLLARTGTSAGIMLHHATMDADALAQLAEFLSAIRAHRQVRFVSMRHFKEKAPCAL